ncbi:TPA: hypothetical protein RQL08_002189 [Vibrio vulnificus]|uniref:Uncharacterized protein n=1 Tax=Vibrio vulnificus TaxID=672 RepID=A0A8H9MZH6_VIBVL|nr:hypothetical protein [Vibrio vulnificus]EHU4943538.1 hypothetical protein [Vibrio vulnificus]ELB7528394.1 hypothetical protein [Vibrio vulnificus]ELK2276706.1 hypothetical protein [Vibrio vulnificus]MCU8511324.1 hypothetical protein [Vibrio vulnificus]MDS1860579.1 hypothetical protein [Vibrio vulnificus]
MLRSYPIAATFDNWLHDAIVGIIQDVHGKLNAGENITSTQPTWRGLVSARLTGQKKDKLIGLHGVRDRLFAFKNAYAVLSQPDREIVLATLVNQNEIENLLNRTQQPQVISQTYPLIHEKAKDLFVFCFEKLTDLNIRVKQYNTIFESLSDKICPFCGIERVMNPEETAQDQDHYLAKSIYPFCAANLRNLVPMCRCCNRDYKKKKDVIEGGSRRAFDPYNCIPPEITLNQTTIIVGSSPIQFEWNIDFLTNAEEAETWDSVFDIRTRYKRDILNEYFDKWLWGFSEICRKYRERGYLGDNLSPQQIRQQLAYYQEDKADNPSTGLAGFLEPLVFNFLLQEYDENNPRIVSLVRLAVLGQQEIQDIEAA